jgi:hypothetical protein
MNASRPWSIRRALRDAAGWLLAALVVWLAFRGYQQPELLIELANFRLC